MSTMTLIQQITIPNPDTLARKAGGTEELTFNHAGAVALSDALGFGVRIAYVNADGSMKEIKRVLAGGSAWNSATTTIRFQRQKDIPAGGIDPAYRLAYFTGASQPGWEKNRRAAGSFAQLAGQAMKRVFASCIAATNGGTFYIRAGQYTDVYAADNMLVFDAYPEGVTATQARGLVTLFAQPNGSGHFPTHIENDGTLHYAGGVGFPQDATWMASWLAKWALEQDGNATFLTASGNALYNTLKAAAAALPITGHMYKSTDASTVMFGFYDANARNGYNTFGTVLWIRLNQDLAILAKAVGSASDAAGFAAEAAAATAALQNESGPLWDYFANTGVANPGSGILIDYLDGAGGNYPGIAASAWAGALGYLTTAQKQRVGDYIAANLGTLMQPQGYLRVCTFPLVPDGYDDSFWSWFIRAVIKVLMETGHASAAYTIMNAWRQAITTAFWATANEWLDVNSVGYDTVAENGHGGHGSFEYPASIAAFYAAARDYASQLDAVDATATVAEVDFDGAECFRRDGAVASSMMGDNVAINTSSPNILTQSGGYWQIDGTHQTSQCAMYFSLPQFSSDGATDALAWEMSADVTMISHGGSGANAFVAGNYDPSGNGHGISLAFKDADTTHVNVLNNAQAWLNAIAIGFSWADSGGNPGPEVTLQLRYFPADHSTKARAWRKGIDSVPAWSDGGTVSGTIPNSVNFAFGVSNSIAAFRNLRVNLVNATEGTPSLSPAPAMTKVPSIDPVATGGAGVFSQVSAMAS